MKDHTDQNDHTTGRVADYRNAIVDYLKEHGLATKDELDQFVLGKFGEEFTQEDWGPVYNKKGRIIHKEKWRNDVDWAKAWLTRNHSTLTIGDLVILLPDAQGHINRVGRIFGAADTVDLIGKVIRKLDTPR